MTLSTTLGHCRRIKATVTHGNCLDCFTAKSIYGVERRETYSIRTRCVEANIHDPGPGPITSEDLNGLSEVRIRHILGNVVMIAQIHPHEATAQAVVREVRLHLAGTDLPFLAVVDPGKEE